MTPIRQVVVPVRSLIASLVSRFAPGRYKQIIERRHPGVRIIGDAGSDVRILKDQARANALRALENAGFETLAQIDDRHCWILLAGTGAHPENDEKLILNLLDYGLRVIVAMDGRRPKRIKDKQHLENLKKRKPVRVNSLKAGNVWMRARGYKQVGWHAAARVHLYDWDDAKGTYRARSAGRLPPMIDKSDSGDDRTIAGLSSDNTRLDKISFPIDVVYTWVDGNDDAWNERRLQRALQLGHKVHKVANSRTRYMNRDELRYSMRSLYYYAPWVRRIYLVTDDQVPTWYDPGSGLLRIISHRKLFPEGSSLPTFNSHAIESVLHRIPDLSEHFLYMNDDVFFSSVIHPEAFFEINGIARTFLSKSMIPFCHKRHSDVASEWGAMNANELLYENCGTMMPYKTKHTPIPLRKTLLTMLENKFPGHFERLRRTPFRTADDLAPTTSLHAYFGMKEGLVVRGDIAYRYLNLARPDLERALQAVAYSSYSMVYCLNDTEIDEQRDFDWDSQERMVTDFLRMMYPYAAPWERDTEAQPGDEDPQQPATGDLRVVIDNKGPDNKGPGG